jgi:hypothetical protein
MNRPPLSRIPRITWTVAWGVAAVLLVALWVRSYWRQDYMLGWASDSRTISSLSSNGWLSLDSQWFNKTSEPSQLPNWEITSRIIQPDPIFGTSPRLAPLPGWNWHSYATRRNASRGLVVPYWFLVVLAIAFAAPPWIHKLNWRFSLRTLLIATTLLSVLLGLVVWLTH